MLLSSLQAAPLASALRRMLACLILYAAAFPCVSRRQVAPFLLCKTYNIFLVHFEPPLRILAALRWNHNLLTPKIKLTGY